jgi:hypothetical protein
MEHLPFEEAINAEPSRTAGEAQRLESEPLYESPGYQHFTYLARGVYWDQITRWLQHYHPNQLLILSSEEFYDDPAVGYRKVLNFLRLPEVELPAYPAEHVGTYPAIPEAIRQRLIEYYAPHNRILRHQLNQLWPGIGDVVVNRFAA